MHSLEAQDVERAIARRFGTLCRKAPTPAVGQQAVKQLKLRRIEEGAKSYEPDDLGLVW